MFGKIVERVCRGTKRSANGRLNFGNVGDLGSLRFESQETALEDEPCELELCSVSLMFSRARFSTGFIPSSFFNGPYGDVGCWLSSVPEYGDDGESTPSGERGLVKKSKDAGMRGRCEDDFPGG